MSVDMRFIVWKKLVAEKLAGMASYLGTCLLAPLANARIALRFSSCSSDLAFAGKLL
jgi:hypothetical protein